jgi:uncharacterized protein
VTARDGAQHCIAYVTLKEGPTILSNLIDCDLTAVRIGQPVRVVFAESENGQKVPMFTVDTSHGAESVRTEK